MSDKATEMMIDVYEKVFHDPDIYLYPSLFINTDNIKREIRQKMIEEIVMPTSAQVYRIRDQIKRFLSNE